MRGVGCTVLEIGRLRGGSARSRRTVGSFGQPRGGRAQRSPALLAAEAPFAHARWRYLQAGRACAPEPRQGVG
eukprot:15483057-Alexandrium_andersonii.AAC.1